MRYLLLIMLLAAPAMAQNPDVPNSAIALDMGIGANFGDELQESQFRFEILMPINDRLTMTTKVENRRLDLKQYQTEGLWKFESRTTFWDIGCKVYIGDK